MINNIDMKKKNVFFFLILLGISLLMFCFAYFFIPWNTYFCFLLNKIDFYLEQELFSVFFSNANSFFSTEKFTFPFYNLEIRIFKISELDVCVTSYYQNVLVNEISITIFKVSNNTNKTLTFYTIIDITPSTLKNHIHKYQCFCFDPIRIYPYEELYLPISFEILGKEIEFFEEHRYSNNCVISYYFIKLGS